MAHGTDHRNLCQQEAVKAESCATQGGCSSGNGEKGLKQTMDSAEGVRQGWKIQGMDCPSCAGKVENAVKGLQGVYQVRVAFATERLLVMADDDSATRQRIINAVNDTGFELSEEGRIGAQQVQPAGFLQRYWRITSLAGIMAVAALVKIAFPSLGTVLFYAATLWGLFPVFQKALKLARNSSPFSIEMLMSVAAIGALFLGETVEAAMVLLLFMVGEHMEAFAAGRARQGVQKLMELTPDTAWRINRDGSKTEVPADTLQPGDTIEIVPGGRLPVDGELLTAGASFDESALTGESVPTEHEAGEKILAGSLSVDRVTRLKVVSEPGESAVDRIIRLIEEAEERKAPVERFIDGFSRWYTPLMMIVALLVAVAPPLLFGGVWVEWIYKALALLLIACPCALVISTPAAVTSALAAATRNGALIKGGAALEQLGSVTNIAFDKTGTLTRGEPGVTEVRAFGFDEETVLKMAAAVEQGSTHPLAKAIVEEAERKDLTIPEVNQAKAMAGMGVMGVVDNKATVVGSPKHQKEVISSISGASEIMKSLEDKGNTMAVVSIDGQLAGMIALKDTLRDDAQEAIAALKALNVNSVMLTGDNTRAAAAIAGELGMDYRAELLPEDKSAAIDELSRNGKVAMVGDGINDAPALKMADIGIAMGGGSDVALETADCALTHNRVTELARMIGLSRDTMSIIRQNVTLAIGSKAVFLVTTLLGLTGLWVAVLADTGATALVTANALRLLRKGR
ncbi:MAG: zinc/cadmium/mercury/lead-transporting ATPase [Endozoicomonas sp.]